MISIIIITKNESSYIEKTLGNLQSLRLNYGIEIILVDGNSNVWDEIFEQGSIQRTHTLLISLIHIFSL